MQTINSKTTTKIKKNEELANKPTKEIKWSHAKYLIIQKKAEKKEKGNREQMRHKENKQQDFITHLNFFCEFLVHSFCLFSIRLVPRYVGFLHIVILFCFKWLIFYSSLLFAFLVSMKCLFKKYRIVIFLSCKLCCYYFLIYCLGFLT